jgi:FlaA1/EpsC-like NDP-sugar epimerase
MKLPPLADLERAVTRRSGSYFAGDMQRRADELRRAVAGRRILVIGGGGSIGGATTRALLAYAPAALHVVDISENYLAELVREIRSASVDISEIDLQTHVLDYGSATMQRFLAAAAPFEFVLNFAAIKHVRSEKDVYSLLHMLDVNIVQQWRLRQWLATFGHGRRYFTVSTDKAANPSSLMGASKRIMEDVAFDTPLDDAATVSSARFANVAFSNGSLLQSFTLRLQKRQPLSVPRDTRRYFITHAEAADICLLAALLAPPGYIAIPAFDAELDLEVLEQVAVRVLAACGLEAWFTDDEAAAKRAVDACERASRWPVLLTPLDTSGEKPYEEFVGDDEAAEDIGFAALRGVRHQQRRDLEPVLEELAALVYTPARTIDKQALVDFVSRAVPTMDHVETGRHLDQRM